MRLTLHALVALALTALTLVGGVAWIGALFLRRRVVGFAALYVALSVGLIAFAPTLGRVMTGCTGGPLQTATVLYCAFNRSHADPVLADLLSDLAVEMDRAYPGTRTRTLDLGFPMTNLPLLPHLSHDDGGKADLAFWYRDADGPTDKLRSPIGYFAFENGPTDCADARATLRWDLDWLQPVFRDLALDEDRTRHALGWLTRDARVSKIFVEPHLARRLNLRHPKLRFQGCRAARHDDNIHLQL